MTERWGRHRGDVLDLAHGSQAGAASSIAVQDPVDVAWDALGEVYDPELGLDVVSLGLIYDVRREPSSVVVEMTFTTPGCPASEMLPEMAREAIARSLGRVDGAGGQLDVDLRVVWDPPWSPSMMDDDAGNALGFRED